MKLPVKLAKLMLVMVCIFMLGACFGGGSPKQVDPGVEDIQPGEKSIIQPPNAPMPQSGGHRILEKNI